ncbi:MAG TPA: hypothetical protein VGF35_06350, partial [Steroidobacteraceae bacterium]
HTKAEAKAGLGEPHSVINLPAAKGPCRERWFYLGTANPKSTRPMDLMMYIDFDADGNTCQAPHA